VIVSSARPLRCIVLHGNEEPEIIACSQIVLLSVTNGLELFKAFFKYFREVDDSVQQ
jgi:hypothetical protein